MQRLSRLRTYLMFEALLSVFVGHAERRKAAVRKAALDHLGKQVPDEALRQKLVPHYEPGCKRLLLSDDYYPALTRPNVEVVESPVASFTAHEVVGEDGIARPVDVVIMERASRRRSSLRRAHRRADGVRLSTSGSTRCRGLRRLHGRRFSQPLPDDRAQLDLGPQLHDLHDRVPHQLHRQRAGLPAAARRARRGGQAGSAATVQRTPAGPVWHTRCGSRADVRAGTSTTVVAIRTLWPDHTWKFRRLTRRFHPGEYIVRA